MIKVRYSPLLDQYADPDDILKEIRDVVVRGDFTLGQEVGEFEKQFSAKVNRRHSIGVGSGTDALKIPLRALGIGHGDEVITAANTFWATVGAIAEVGATPVLVDCGDDMQIAPSRIEAAITPNTKAIIPVHIAGNVARMDEIVKIAKAHDLSVVEDGCQSQMATRNGKMVGSWGIATAFSMHPLKIINVWGDAGVIVTDDAEMDRQLRLLRNHGLRNRDEMECLGYNSRLDTVQAVVGKKILKSIEWIASRRRENGALYIKGFADMPEIRLQAIDDGVDSMFLFFAMLVDQRDELVEHCTSKGIDVKVHYPIPLYRQDALKHLGYVAGDFPETDKQALECISLPVDQHLSEKQIHFVIETVRNFYGYS